jgi:hypothetical protein
MSGIGAEAAANAAVHARAIAQGEAGIRIPTAPEAP